MFMVVSFAFILFSFIKSSNGDEPAYGAYKIRGGDYNDIYLKCNTTTLRCSGTKEWIDGTNFISTQAFYPYGKGLAPRFIIRMFDSLFGEPCQRMEYGGKCLTVKADSNKLQLYECDKTLSDYQCWTWNVKNVESKKTLNFLGDGFDFEVVLPSQSKQSWYMLKYSSDIFNTNIRTLTQINEIKNTGIKLNKICMIYSQPSMIRFNCE